jgi:histidinol dehydrogenase
VFLGQWTPEAIGDYIGGPHHGLSAARNARHASREPHAHGMSVAARVAG